MNRFLCLIGVLAGACLMQGCAAQGDPPEQMVAAVQQLNQQYTDSFSKGDVDGVMATYWNSPDLVVFPPGVMQVKGWENAHQAIGDAMKALAGGKLELLDTHYLPIGDAVVCWGLWIITFPDTNGALPPVLGRFTAIAMKKDGKWVFIHDHPSEPLPAPAKP